MARSAANWESRRALTDNPATSPETYKNAARQLLDLDLPSEAAIFFALAGDEAGLTEIVDRAVEEGNFFIFQAAVSRLKEPGQVGRERVEALRQAAEKSGRALYAEKAAAYLKDNF